MENRKKPAAALLLTLALLAGAIVHAGLAVHEQPHRAAPAKRSAAQAALGRAAAGPL